MRAEHSFAADHSDLESDFTAHDGQQRHEAFDRKIDMIDDFFRSSEYLGEGEVD